MRTIRSPSPLAANDKGERSNDSKEGWTCGERSSDWKRLQQSPLHSSTLPNPSSVFLLPYSGGGGAMVGCVHQNVPTEMCTKFRNTLTYHNSTTRPHRTVYRLLVLAWHHAPVDDIVVFFFMIQNEKEVFITIKEVTMETNT